jgi:Protein of unknown function (DUF3305)
MGVAVVMRRRKLDNPWQSELWEVAGVLAPYQGQDGPRLIVERADESQWLHTGLKLQLFRDESEGYYLNITTSEPRIFVMWRMAGEQAVPEFVTVSSNEASGWMDSGEEVGSAPMEPEAGKWVAEFVRDNYRPEPKKKRIRPESFKHPADRAKH